MTMKKCKDCGTEVSKSAKICPKCGKKLKHTALRVIIGIFVIIIGVGVLATSDTNNTATTGTSSVQEEKVTIEKFNQIE